MSSPLHPSKAELHQWLRERDDDLLSLLAARDAARDLADSCQPNAPRLVAALLRLLIEDTNGFSDWWLAVDPLWREQILARMVARTEAILQEKP